MNTKKITKAKKIKFIKLFLKEDEEFIYLNEKAGLTLEHFTILDLNTKKILQEGDKSLGDAEIFINREGYIEMYINLKLDKNLQAEYNKKFQGLKGTPKGLKIQGSS